MILNFSRFVETERPFWLELEAILNRMEAQPGRHMTLDEVQRLQYLYERAGSGLVRLDEFSEPQVRASLQTLVARTYSHIHEMRSSSATEWKRWLVEPARAFRRQRGAFVLSVVLTLLGCLLGALAIQSDVRNKAILMPFPALMKSPQERVAEEESAKRDPITDRKARFSASLMTHNIRVSLFTLACGMTFGIGTTLSLFYNGVILGAVSADYVSAGQTQFLLGWLLPHGSIEIPAILIAGQAGFVLASALIGWGESISRENRLRMVRRDVVSLASGLAVMLVWAGVAEAFISQYHQPVLPYSVKIVFGLVEIAVLAAYLQLAGRRET